MPRLRQVAKADADPFAQQLYKMLFGERDPVKEPGTATGTPCLLYTPPSPRDRQKSRMPSSA